MRNLIIGVIIVAVLAIGTFFLIQGNRSDKNAEESSNSSSQDSNISNDNSANSSKDAVAEITITYDDNGFNPKTAIIKSGGKITWVNKSNSEVQIGADPHPSHTGNREATGDDFVLSLDPDESKTVTVEKMGTFGYHNHLAALDAVTIEVK